jgi:CRISPR-associated endonuclease/helicase Cas3
MRGGAFRDESWVRNPLQPTVVTSTVDQVGSRLLFRGYGVSRNSWPLHAGLIGNDALILLDEAHCSRAFAQTLKRVEGYRGNGWTSRPLGLPFQFVEMTGTPSHKVKLENRVGLSPADLEVEALRKRLDAEKPTQLIDIKARKNDTDNLVDALATHARVLAVEVDARRVAVFSNRVKTVLVSWSASWSPWHSTPSIRPTDHHPERLRCRDQTSILNNRSEGENSLDLEEPDLTKTRLGVT